GRRVTALNLDILSWPPADFSATMLWDAVITERAREVLLRAGLTGFETRSANIGDVPKRLRTTTLPTLSEFIVVGCGGAAHPLSGIRKLVDCEGCGLVRYSSYEHGIVVDMSAYDGSDFFTVDGYPKYILVTERAKRVIEGENLTNVRFTV